MSNKINMTIPINSLGYGMHALGYYKILLENNWDISINSITKNETDLVNSNLLKDLGISTEVNKSIIAPKYNAPNIIVWHSDHFAQYKMQNVPNIGMGAFELSPITKEQQAGFLNVDLACTYSTWGLNEIHNPNKKKVLGPVWSYYFKNISKFENENFNTNNNPIVISPGKWEQRKGHPLFLELLSEYAEDNLNLNVYAFWNNSFTGHLTQPIKALHDAGWNLKNVISLKEFETTVYLYSKKNIQIYLFGHIPKYTNMISLYKQGDAMISLSFGEGWDMPLLDALGLDIPIFITANTAHLEYHNPLYCISEQEHSYEIAYDGVWFNRQGNWAVPDKKYARNKLRSFLFKIPTKDDFFFKSYTDKINPIRNNSLTFNQLKEAIEYVY
jgi:hypothetical protein